MQNTSTDTRANRGLRLAAIAAAVALIAIGIGAVVKGLDGRSTVHSALAQEQIVGTPFMTPTGITAKAHEEGLRNVTAPGCSVANTPVADGDSARCFAEYMRIDALIATGGKTYSQMPRFATDDGKGTNNPAQAQRGPDGKPVNNPARNVWVTETALATALNTSYMAEQIALFGTVVGGALLLVGLAIAGFATAGLRLPRTSFALPRRRQAAQGA